MTPSAGAWCCRTTRCAGCRRTTPSATEAIRDHFAYWDDIAVVHNGAAHRLGRAWLCRHRAQADADPAAGPRPRTGRRPAASRPSSSRPRTTARTMTSSSPRDGINSLVRREYAEVFQPDIDMRASASSSGWARTRNSTTPSPSSSRRPNTAGSGRMSTSSMPIPRPSSSNACPRPGTAGASSTCPRKRRSRPAGRSSRRHLGGHELMSNAAHLRGSAVWMQFPRVICEHLVP